MKLILTIFLSMALVACGGRSATPIQTAQPGDRQLSCEAIEAQVVQYQNTLPDLDLEISSRKKRNIGWGIAGIFLFPLWFGLDLGEAPETEKSAVQKRLNQLTRYAASNSCKNLAY